MKELLDQLAQENQAAASKELKSTMQEIANAVDSLNRAQEMLQNNEEGAREIMEEREVRVSLPKSFWEQLDRISKSQDLLDQVKPPDESGGDIHSCYKRHTDLSTLEITLIQGVITYILDTTDRVNLATQLQKVSGMFLQQLKEQMDKAKEDPEEDK